jgi:hypothetical protein
MTPDRAIEWALAAGAWMLVGVEAVICGIVIKIVVDAYRKG